jgi:signal transduction histidine kinase
MGRMDEAEDGRGGQQGELRRERDARIAAETAAGRMRFMAEASAVLASSLDYETTLRNVAALAVPSIADWCAVDLLNDDGTLQRVAVQHADPERIRLVQDLQERYPPDPSSPQGAYNVARTGVSEHGDVPDELLAASAESPEHLDLLRSLGLRSYIVVPLSTRNRVLGVLSLVHAESEREYVASDVAFAEDLGRRAAVAIDNARLVAELEEARSRLEEQSVELELQATELEAHAEELNANAATLRTNEARLAAVIENAPVGILIASAPDGRILLGNAAVERILRHPVRFSESVSQYSEWVMYRPDGEPLDPREYPLARVLATGRRAGPDDLLYERGDGTRGWIRITGAPIHSPSGGLTAALVVIDDIDAERRAAEAGDVLLRQVAEERRRLSDVFENAPAVMALYSGPDHIVTLVNPTWERTVGKTEAIGRPFREVFPEFAGTGLLETLDEVYRSGEPFHDPELNVPLERWGSGVLEDTFWDLVWLPLAPREDGTRDILVHAVETTSQVRARRQVQRLTGAALAVQSAGTVEEALQVATDEARRLLEAHQAVATVALGEDAARTFRAVSSTDAYSRWSDPDDPATGMAGREGLRQLREPVRLDSAGLQSHPAWQSDERGEAPPLKGWLAAPLVSRDGGNLGMIEVCDRVHGDFGEDDEAVLAQLAQLASVAIENARLYDEAVEASRTKTGFLATMSHELRTPLNAMIGYAELLQLGVPKPIPPEAQEQVGRIRLAAQHLLQLIEEILTFSRVEAGRERVIVEPVPLSELADEVVAIIDPLASRKQLRFEVELPPGEVALETDPRKVRQVLLNLLGNAVKFTDEGTVSLRMILRGDALLVEVADTGIGIGEQDLHRIYEPFWQAESELHSRAAGTGLGLPVTRQFVELLGGSMDVRSEPGRGTTFSVTLPLRWNPVEEPEPASTA